MNLTAEWLKDLLAQNRDEFKKVIVEIQWYRNECFIENSLDDDAIMERYKTDLKDVLLDFLVVEFPDVHFADLWCAIEDLDLIEFFEPRN